MRPLDRRGHGRRTSDRRVAPTHPRPSYSTSLYAYTAVTIVAGLAVLVWATATLPLLGSISLGGGASSPTGILLGLGYWTATAVLGSIRVARMRGRGVLTFHLPFVVAAMALGGPVAAAWVVFLGTTELREFREVPWYGILANHAGLALAAVVAGLAMTSVRAGLAPTAGPDAASAQLLGLLVGTVVFTALSVSLAIGTVMLRERLTLREVLTVYDDAHRSTAATEAVLGWLLALVYQTVGWWAPVVCAVLVLVTWDAYDAREEAKRDPMTGLLTRLGFARRLDAAIRRARRGWESGALIAIDLDGFKAINDTHGHAAGDAVLRATGARLSAAIRPTDASARLGGDEFAVLLLGAIDAGTAESLAWRLLQRLREPVEYEDRRIRVGGSLGVALLGRRDLDANADTLHRLADSAMYEAKRAGGGVHLHGPGCPTVEPDGWTPSPTEAGVTAHA